jgi:hypothetical protein
MLDTPFKLFEKIKNQIELNSLFVEIGSDRGSGSTYYLQQLAEETRNLFVTVDVDSILLNAKIRSATMTGEEWVVTELPKETRKVGLVFLDNFDWLISPIAVRQGSAGPDTYNLISEYKNKHMELNNINSTVAHTKQILGLLPFMHPKCTVLLGDTKFNMVSDSFSGKGAAAVYILLAEGFTVLSASSKSNYILMGRGMREDTMSNIDQSSLSKVYKGVQKRADTIVYFNDE